MDWENKTCVVTGGSGFIGKYLVEELVKRKAKVIILDSRAENSKTEFIESRSFDIRTQSHIDDDVDFIFHLAAIANPNECNEKIQLAYDVNVTGTLNMLKMAEQKKVKKFIFPSSAQLYGRHPKYLPIDEKHPIEYVDNFYNLTKKTGEDLCEFFNKKFSLPIVYFRLFNSFGPQQAGDYLIPTIIKQAIEKQEVELWNEKPTRDFTFVSDTVGAFIAAAESDFSGGPINIGSGTEVSVGEIAQQIARSFDAKIQFLNKEVTGSMRMACNREYAKQVLNWEPKISFQEGLDRTIKWFSEQQK